MIRTNRARLIAQIKAYTVSIDFLKLELADETMSDEDRRLMDADRRKLLGKRFHANSLLKDLERRGTKVDEAELDMYDDGHGYGGY